MIRGEHGKLRYYAEPASSNGKPIVIHLHGTGERHTTNLDNVLRYGPLKLIKDGVKLPEATYVQPQLSSGNWDVNEINKLFSHILGMYTGDPNRQHLMGVSLGGYGARNFLASQYAARLASAVLMSPGGGKWGDVQINTIANVGVPLWISHATNDKTNGALYGTSDDAVKRLRARGTKAELRFTTFGLSGHSTGSAWGRFMTPDNFYLWDWMNAQSKYQQPIAPVDVNLEAIKNKLFDFIQTL